MEFRSSKGIFQQIADNICEKILSDEYTSGDKIPSVRELAESLGVNHNTIMRTYSELQRDQIIENKRGIGFFVSADATKEIRKKRKSEFFKLLLPEFVKQVEILSITSKELQPLFDQLKKNEHENK